MKICNTSQFKKDYKKIKKSGFDLSLLRDVIEIIASQKNEEELAENNILINKYRNHKLSGNYTGRWECHIKSDWILIYKVEIDEVTFERTGTHSQLFR